MTLMQMRIENNSMVTNKPKAEYAVKNRMRAPFRVAL